MSEYGLDKDLVCFASAQNDHINLYVDQDNKFYQLDNVISNDLYVYKGPDFDHMMRELLELEEKDNFQIIGSRRIVHKKYKEPTHNIFSAIKTFFKGG